MAGCEWQQNLQMRKVHCKFDAPKTKTASSRIAPTIACVVRLEFEAQLLARSTTLLLRGGKDERKTGVVWRRLCGVKTENSLPEIRIADRLPMRRRSSPSEGFVAGLKPEVIGSRMSEMMLFPASLAPLRI